MRYLLTVGEPLVKKTQDGEGVPEIAQRASSICTVEGPLPRSKFNWTAGNAFYQL